MAIVFVPPKKPGCSRPLPFMAVFNGYIKGGVILTTYIHWEPILQMVGFYLRKLGVATDYLFHLLGGVKIIGKLESFIKLLFKQRSFGEDF